MGGEGRGEEGNESEDWRLSFYIKTQESEEAKKLVLDCSYPACRCGWKLGHVLATCVAERQHGLNIYLLHYHLLTKAFVNKEWYSETWNRNMYMIMLCCMFWALKYPWIFPLPQGSLTSFTYIFCPTLGHSPCSRMVPSPSSTNFSATSRPIVRVWCQHSPNGEEQGHLWEEITLLLQRGKILPCKLVGV